MGSSLKSDTLCISFSCGCRTILGAEKRDPSLENYPCRVYSFVEFMAGV